jgi:Ser/Thr protein kinase RdoA (MazF antagonist)
MMDALKPFSNLSPDSVLAAVEQAGFQVDGRLLALNSYENRVYQVGIEGQAPLIAKFYRPGRWQDDAIHEEHLFELALAEAEVPAVPPIQIQHQMLFHHEQYRFSLFEKKGGRAPELDRSGVLTWIGRFLGRLHAVGAQAEYRYRPTLNIETFGEIPKTFLLETGFIPIDIRSAYDSVIHQALDEIRRCYDRAGDISLIRLHGDCHLGNLLWTDEGPHFVDFDDSRMGPAIQDLWMLLSGTSDDMQSQWADILAGYQDFHHLNPAEFHLVEALRTLRLIHYSAWIAQRWDDPAFKVAFSWFNTQQYWQDRVLELREQIALMQEPLLIKAEVNGNCY